MQNLSRKTSHNRKIAGKRAIRCIHGAIFRYTMFFRFWPLLPMWWLHTYIHAYIYVREAQCHSILSLSGNISSLLQRVGRLLLQCNLVACGQTLVVSHLHQYNKIIKNWPHSERKAASAVYSWRMWSNTRCQLFEQVHRNHENLTTLVKEGCKRSASCRAV